MSIDTFAGVGVFVISAIGFALGTGLFGFFITDDYDQLPLASWFMGIFVYGLTVLFMWWR